MLSYLKSYATPLTLTILSFLFYLSLISKGPYHLDCLHLAIQAEKTIATGEMQHLFGFGYPLTVLLGAFFVFLGRLFSLGDPVTLVNFMSVVFSSLCILPFYKIGRELLDQRAAFYSTVTFSLFPIFLGLSQYGKNHTVSLFFLLLGIHYLLEFQKTSLNRYLLLAILSLAGMGANRLQDLLLMFIPLSFLFLFPPYRNEIKLSRRSFTSLILFWILTALIVLSFHFPFLIGENQQSYTNQFSEFWKMGFSQNFAGFVSPYLWHSLKIHFVTLTPVGLVMAFIGLILLSPKSRYAFLFLILWFVIPLLFYGNLKTTVPRLLLLSSVPLIIAQGGVYSRLSLINPSFRFVTFGIFAGINLLLLSIFYPIFSFRHQNALYVDFAHWVSEKTEENAHIITADDGLFISHYGNRAVIPQLNNLYSSSQDRWKNFKANIDALLEKDIPVYITGAGMYNNNLDLIFPNQINQNYQMTLIGRHLIEDWHRGEIIQDVSSGLLFKVEPRRQAGLTPNGA